MEIRFRLNEAETKKLIDSAITRSKKDGKIMSTHNYCKVLTLENL